MIRIKNPTGWLTDEQLENFRKAPGGDPEEFTLLAIRPEEERAGGVVIGPESGLTESDIAAIQRVVELADAGCEGERELVSIDADVMRRCRRNTDPDYGVRPDLTPEDALDKAATHGSLNYEETLGLRQCVKAPDPALDMQDVVDEAFADGDDED